MQNVHFREAKFQNFPEGHGPRPLTCTRAFGAPFYFCHNNSLVFPTGLPLPMGSSHYNVTYLKYTKTFFLFQ